MRSLGYNWIIASFLAPLLLLLTASATAEQLPVCSAGSIYRSNGQYAKMETRLDRRDYMRQALGDAWREVTPYASNLAIMVGSVNFTTAIGAYPTQEAIAKAHALTAAQRLRAIEGYPFDTKRVDRIIEQMASSQGNSWMPIAQRFNQVVDVASGSIDAVNFFYAASQAAAQGDRASKVKALQASMTLARDWLGATWGHNIGPMMAMTGFLEYSLNSFGEEAWGRYEAYYWNAYRNFTTSNERMSSQDWLDLYKSEGEVGIRSKLNGFWEHPDGVKALAYLYQDKGDANKILPVNGDAYAMANYPKPFAARYMIEVVEPAIWRAQQKEAEEALWMNVESYEQDCGNALADAMAIKAAWDLIMSDFGPSFAAASCPAPQPFRAGIVGTKEKSVENKKLQALQRDLDHSLATQGVTLNTVERVFRSNVHKGFIIDVVTDFSTSSLPNRQVNERYQSGVDLLIPQDVLGFIWAGKPQTAFAKFRTAYIAFGKGLAELGPEVLGDHFGPVNVISRYEDAKTPLLFYITGFDYAHRNRLSVKNPTWSGFGKLGVSVCFGDHYLFQDMIQTEETEKHAVKGAVFNSSGAVGVVASDVIRQTLDMASERVKQLADSDVQAFLASTADASVQPTRITVPRLNLPETVSEDAAPGHFKGALETTIKRVVPKNLTDD